MVPRAGNSPPSCFSTHLFLGHHPQHTPMPPFSLSAEALHIAVPGPGPSPKPRAWLTLASWTSPRPFTHTGSHTGLSFFPHLTLFPGPVSGQPPPSLLNSPPTSPSSLLRSHPVLALASPTWVPASPPLGFWPQSHSLVQGVFLKPNLALLCMEPSMFLQGSRDRVPVPQPGGTGLAPSPAPLPSSISSTCVQGPTWQSSG